MYKVLLVDDEYMILEGLKYLLSWEELGFTIIHTAKRGQEALDYLETHEIDLLITDVTMHGMLGTELVKKVREKNMDIPILILSGYQEFEYVKQGMELGVKNYLVKPIDGIELKKNLLQIKHGIEKQRQKEVQKALYCKAIILHWLNDELNEDEILSFQTDMNFPLDRTFTTIIIKSPTLSESVEKVLNRLDQKLFITQEHEDSKQIIVIYIGNRLEVEKLIQEIKSYNYEGNFQLFIGETVNRWKNVYESYEIAENLMKLKDFYRENENARTVLEITPVENEEKLHFLSFNKALMIGDTKTIDEELTVIFSQMKQLKFMPENVHYVTFMLFTDIFRQYPSISQEEYDSFLSQIKDSNSIVELYTLLKNMLDNLYKNSDHKRYSDIINKAIEIISNRYREDLSLKIVAEELFLNPAYLGQLFKKDTGRSFSQFLNQIRIKKAQQLLLHSTLMVHEIAEASGYNNTNYFAKMFRKLNGLNPKEFREKYISNYQSLAEI